LKDWHPAWQNALKEWNMRESQTVQGFIREGELKRQQTNLRQVLETRFGALSESLLQQIEQTTDLDKLQRAFLQALTMKQLDDLTL